jgi:hypothetical protein
VRQLHAVTIVISIGVGGAVSAVLTQALSKSRP